MNILLHAPRARESWKHDLLSRLAELVPDVQVRQWPDPDARGGDFAVDDARDIEIAIMGPAPPAELWALLPGLRWVMGLGAGVDNLVASVPPHIALTRIVDSYLTADMTQYVLYHVLRYHRGFDAYVADQAGRAWQQRPYPRPSERTVGVLGLGELGADAATHLASLGFAVLGWSRTQKQLPGVTSLYGADGFHDVLEKSQILICLLPRTPDTENLIDARALARMPAGSYLINASRGALVVEADLLAALDSGHLAGATLDVFRHEPLPPDHPLWTHPRVTVTPHLASLTHPASVAALFAANLRRYLAGQPLHQLVDRERQY